MLLVLELFIETEPMGYNNRRERERERDVNTEAEKSHSVHLQAGDPGKLVAV